MKERFESLPRLTKSICSKILEKAYGPSARFQNVAKAGLNGIQITDFRRAVGTVVLARTYGKDYWYTFLVASGLAETPESGTVDQGRLRMELLRYYQANYVRLPTSNRLVAGRNSTAKV